MGGAFNFLKMELRNFKPEEFTMDGKVVFHEMQPEFLALLDQCREDSGVPFKITSCYRSPEKNRRVGGSPGSMHLKGRAVDIVCPQSANRAKIMKAALALGLTVGVMPTALHLDNRDNQIVFHYYSKYQQGIANEE